MCIFRYTYIYTYIYIYTKTRSVLRLLIKEVHNTFIIKYIYIYVYFDKYTYIYLHTHSVLRLLIKDTHDTFIIKPRGHCTKLVPLYANVFPDATLLFLYRCVSHLWVTLHLWMSHVTSMNESCRTYEWSMSHIWMQCVPQYADVCPIHIWHSASHLYTTCPIPIQLGRATYWFMWDVWPAYCGTHCIHMCDVPQAHCGVGATHV